MRAALSTAARASRACSSGRNTLTSPELGLSVPTKATSASGQNACRPAKPTPVATIVNAAICISREAGNRWPSAPTAIVAAAEPASVSVLSTPISTTPIPSARR